MTHRSAADPALPPALQDAQRIDDVPRFWARTAPGALALTDAGRPVSYRMLEDAIAEMAALLRTRGVGAGDRVLVALENGTAAVAAIFAASRLQAWPVLVNARLSEGEIDAIVRHASPRTMLFTIEVSKEAAAHAARWGAKAVHTACLGRLALTEPDRDVRPEPTDRAPLVAAMIYSSGTTGAPKGVMVTHRGLLTFAGVSIRSRRLTHADCAYAALPMSHIFGLATQLVAMLSGGCKLYIVPRFDPQAAIEALERHGVTILQGVPTMFTRIVDAIEARGTPLAAPQLRFIYTGAAPLDPTMKRRVESLFGLPLHHGYGLTEYAGSLVLTSLDRPRVDSSAGHLVEGAALRIVDAAGHDVVPGEPGEIWIRGPGLMLGYYRDPEQTAAVMKPGGWYNTGDIGRQDADGALFLVGRTKELIIRSGFNVYPVEVEAALASHPSIRIAAVVGRPAEAGNEDVIAFVELQDGHSLDAAALQAHLAGRLAPYKRPAEIIAVTSMPATASGKIKKLELKAMLRDD